MNNFRASRVAAAALAAALALPALAQNVAVVNGKAIPKSRADVLTQQVERSGRPMTPELRQQIKDEVIAREVFVQEAQKQGLENTQEFKDQMALARETILIREFFADYAKKHPVTDAEAKAEYDRIVASTDGKEYKARHILVDKESDAKDIIARLKKGAKFDDIAKKQSKDKGSAVNGGNLDWAPAGQYVPEFSQAMAKLKKGETTDTPVKTQFGYHVIRLDDVRDAKIPPFEQVKPQLMQQLQGQKLAKYQEELRGKAKVE